ncbi:Uncharacterised protein [Legionella donaldsonii]|uniref:Uncharacterized protein n=1 Tax=Legionella donaldsonii TaxID=45060 RepID=A0A378J031_9GAMM|nr:hypothetical protein [Legionella donaldsonii]STX41062.1 Uncharacterised protein [Legionella donaldsonii]
MPTNNPFNDEQFFPMLAVISRQFFNNKLENQGDSILDRNVEEADIQFMQGLQLKDMEFVLPAKNEQDERVRAKFAIKRKDSDESLAFSNRPATRGEMRGARLRERLEILKAENGDLTLYEAMERIYRDNFKDSDLMTYFLGSPSFENVEASYKHATLKMGDLILQYLKEHPEAEDEELIAYGKSKMAEIMPRDGLTLLEDTLRNPTENSKALGRVLLAIKSGTLTVNGQAPDDAYPIGEYLTHGGRVNFDVSALSAEEQQQFYAFITNSQAKTRAFATHRAGGTDANGSPAEAKSGLLGAISDAFRALVGASKHAGINLAIGGNHIASREGASGGLGKNPDESGEWGHMYLHQDTNIVMVGVEASAPGKHNTRTGESHSKTGAAGELSPFLQKKIDSRELHEEQIKAGKTPLSTKEKYNWATVKISSEQLRQMMLADQGADYAALVKAKPDNAQPAEPNRKEKMEAWAKATKEGNKTSMAAKIFGFLLFAAGIVLAFAPIPVVSQAVGGWLAGLGLGVATGTVTLGAGLTAAAVGLGVFGLGTRQDPEKPHTLYEKNLSKLPPVEVVEKPVVVQEQVVHDVVQEHVVRDVVQEHVEVDKRRLSNSSDSGSELDLVGFKGVEEDLSLVVKSKDEVDEARRLIGGIDESSVDSPVVINPGIKKDVVNPTNTDQSTFTL